MNTDHIYSNSSTGYGNRQGKLLITTRNNPCPICGDTKGKCRTSLPLVLCMNEFEGRFTPQGFKYLGLTKDGLWGKYLEISDRPDRYIPPQREEKPIKKEESLSEKERDRAIRAISSALGLRNVDKEDLEKRGLSEDYIEKNLFFSVEKGYNRVPVNVPLSFPNMGEKKGERYLYSSVNGYACIAFNEKGLATGLQLRNRDFTGEGQKYIWLKGMHLKNGELPLTCHNLEKNNSSIVLLTEAILKPCCAASKFGLPAIGASGGNFLASFQQLKEMLRYGNTGTVWLVPDAGDILNRHTQIRWLNLAQELTRAGLIVEFLWWNQIAKSDNDIDELDSLDRVKTISVEEFQKLVDHYTINESEFVRHLKYLKSGIRPSQLKGFASKEKAQIVEDTIAELPRKIYFKKGRCYLDSKFKKEIPFPKIEDYRGHYYPLIEYEKGEQHTLLALSFKNGWGDILDKSFMGSGKSHEMGLFSPDYGKVFYVDNNHRNVSTKTVERYFVDLEPRHNGYVEKNGKLVKAYGDEENPHEGNCHNFQIFEELQAKGHNPFLDDGKNIICQACPFVEQCGKSFGAGYGYLKARFQTLQASKIRCHPYSMPRTDDYDYKKDILILEESSHLLHPVRQITASWSQFLLCADIIQHKEPEVYESVMRPLLEDLRSMMVNPLDQPRYGYTDSQIRLRITPFPRGMEWAIAKLHDCLSTQELRGTKQEVIEKIKNYAPNVVIPIILAIMEKSGALRINNGMIGIVEKDESFIDILKSSRARIYLDSTANVEHTAKIIGKNSSEILVIRQQLPFFKNLKVRSVYMEGLGSRSRSEECNKRLQAMIEYYLELDSNTKVLGFKGDNQIDGYWGNDNRGTNAFSGYQTYVSYGTPFPNLGAIEDEYLATFGNLDGFNEYYDHLVQAEIIQNLGRPRHHLYPNKNFTIDFISSKPDLSFLTEEYGIEIEYCYAFEFIPEAGTAAQITRASILECFRKLEIAKTKITQAEIAKMLGITQQAISSHAKAFAGGWKGLLEKYKSTYIDTNRGTCIFDRDLDSQFKEWLKLDVLDFIQGVIEFVAENGFSTFIELLEQTSLLTQSQVYGNLLPLFIPEIREDYDEPSTES